jgi:phthiocerol/phenolphthiocerol synthesis type-I polyketide synthase E
MALYDLAGHEAGDSSVEAEAWRPWLARAGADPSPTGRLLRAALDHLAGKDPAYRELLAGTAYRPDRDK